MWVAFGLSLVCACLVFPGSRSRSPKVRPLLVGTGRHWRRNYGRRAFLRLAAATAAAGILAYSGADEACERLHSGTLRNGGTDLAARVLKPLGDRFWFLNWLMVGAVDAWFKTSSFSRWGRRNFEAMVVGLPTLWTVQRGLGANRPSSDDANPRWRPLAADNSASGHAFMAAVPWLNLARRTGAGSWRGAARLGSILTGWSRINDRKHYLSQVILGWTIAWNATAAVADDDGAVKAPATMRNDDAENPTDDS